MDDRVSESGKATDSNPPAHGGYNTYRRKNGIGIGEASKRGSDETSNSGYAETGGVSIAGRGVVGGLEEIPLVPVEVFEDGGGAIGFLAGSFEETDAARLVSFVIAPEVVGVEEEEDAAAGLVADGEGLFVSVGFGEEKCGAAGIGRSDEEPAFVAGKRSVLEEVEAEFLRVEPESFVIVADNEGQVSNGLRHDSGLWHFRGSG